MSNLLEETIRTEVREKYINKNSVNSEFYIQKNI